MKRKIILLCLLFLSGILSAESELVNYITSGLRNFDQWHYINDNINNVYYGNDLNKNVRLLFHCDKDELSIVRNAIYARHGYKFTSPVWQNYFNQFKWYNGTKENVEHDLSNAEHKYIALILRMEENYPHLSNQDKDIIGFWIQEEGMLSFIKDLMDIGKWTGPILPFTYFRIYESGTFLFHYAQRFVYGLWSMENNEFTMIPLGVSNNTSFLWAVNYMKNIMNTNFIFSVYNEHLPESEKNRPYAMSEYYRPFLEGNLTRDQRRWFKISDFPSFSRR